MNLHEHFWKCVVQGEYLETTAEGYGEEGHLVIHACRRGEASLEKRRRNSLRGRYKISNNRKEWALKTVLWLDECEFLRLFPDGLHWLGENTVREETGSWDGKGKEMSHVLSPWTRWGVSPEQPKGLTVEGDIGAPLRQEGRKWVEDRGKTQTWNRVGEVSKAPFQTALLALWPGLSSQNVSSVCWLSRDCFLTRSEEGMPVEPWHFPCYGRRGSK